MNERTYIVAQTYRQYLDWCQKEGLNPNGSAVKFVRSDQDLKGLRNVRIFFLTGWTKRPDWREVHALALVVGRWQR